MSRKTVLAMLLAMAMTLTAFSGCGGTAESSASPAATASATAQTTAASAPIKTEESELSSPAEESVSAEESAVEENTYFPLADTKSFSYWIVYPPMFEGFADGPQDFTVYVEAQKRLNVSIDFNSVPIPSAKEQFMLMIAGGEYTDAILNFAGQYSGSLDDAINQDIIIDLTDPLQKYAPDYIACQQKSDSRVLSSYTEAGNQAVMFGFQTSDGRIPKFGAVIRQDWLDELGMDSPVTVDDYHDVLAAFKEKENCASPYGLAADGVSTPGSMQGAYNIIVPQNNDNNGFYQIDGKVHFGPVEEGFRSMLTTLSSWYKEGLIDSNFVSDTSSATSGEVSSDKIASGQVGIWRGYATNLSNYENEIGTGAKITGLTSMRENKDDTLHFGLDADNAASNMGISVTSACTDVELVLRFFNYYFTEEGSLLCNYGVEGDTFTYNDAGDPVYTDVITNNPQGMTMDVALCLYTGGSTTVPYEIDNSKNYYTYSDEQMAAGKAWMDGTDGAYQLPNSYTGLLTADELESLNAKYNDIITTYKETVLQFITGTKPMSEFDDFVAQLKSMGIEDCISIIQTGLDRYMEKAA